MIKTPKVIVDLKELKNSCFVIMPYDKKYSDEYENTIKPLLNRLQIESVIAKDIFKIQNIMNDIWEAIRSCRFVIAEMTEKNPNVLFEVGLAKAIGKPVIVITRKEKDVPSDIRMISRYYYYDTNLQSSWKNLEDWLKRVIENIINGDNKEHLLKDIDSNNCEFPQIQKSKENNSIKNADNDKNWLLLILSGFNVRVNHREI